MSSGEVCISGLGVLSPAGVGTERTWSALLAGRRAVRPVAGLDLAGCRTNFAGQIPAFVPLAGTEHAHRTCQLAIAAAAEAVSTAGLAGALSHGDYPENPKVVLGTSKPLKLLNGSFGSSLVKELVGVKEGLMDVISGACDAPARSIAGHLGITGPALASVTACSTGAHALIRAARMVRDRDTDLVLAGAADVSLDRLWIAAYERMGVLAPAHPAGGAELACRPFDRTRAGFAVGEGAAVFVLESGEAVRRRGARPIARIAGWATGSDPTGLTQLDPEGGPLARVIELACTRAGCPPEDIGAIVAHGTATASNDLIETQAIRKALGPRAARIPIVSVKGAIGHLMGAAGAVEAALAVLTCRDRQCPGTATLIEPDPELGPLTLPKQAFQPASRAVLKTSLGFGGHLAALIVTPA